MSKTNGDRPSVRSFSLQLPQGVHVLPPTPGGEHLCVSIDEEGRLRGFAFVREGSDASWSGVADYCLSRMCAPDEPIPDAVLSMMRRGDDS